MAKPWLGSPLVPWFLLQGQWPNHLQGHWPYHLQGQWPYHLQGREEHLQGRAEHLQWPHLEPGLCWRTLHLPTGRRTAIIIRRQRWRGLWHRRHAGQAPAAAPWGKSGVRGSCTACKESCSWQSKHLPGRRRRRRGGGGRSLGDHHGRQILRSRLNHSWHLCSRLVLSCKLQSAGDDIVDSAM